MNVLDENIDAVAREHLRSLKVHFRHIGSDIGQPGMKDLNDVIPLLHSLRDPTFFTRDKDFYSRSLLHARYCLIHLKVPPRDSAEYVVRLLRHKEFRKKVDRIGKVICVSPNRLSYLDVNSAKERYLAW